MRLGLGLGISGSHVNTVSSVPLALPATNIASNSFTANWAAFPHAVNYFLTVLSSGTALTSYNALNVGGVTSYSVTGLSGLHAYLYEIRVSLSAVPAFRFRSYTDYQHYASVVYINGDSNELQTALDLITDASVTNRYRLYVPKPPATGGFAPYTYNMTDTNWKTGVDLYAEPGTIFYSNDVTVSGALFQVGGKDCMWTNVHIKIEDTDGIGIHNDNSGTAATTIYNNVSVETYGTSKFGFAGGIYGGQSLILQNCTSYAENDISILYHNKFESDPLKSAQVYLINPHATNGDLIHPQVAWENKGSTSGTDFLYIAGGNIGAFDESNAGGAGETSIYIGPTTTYTSLTFADPSSHLNLTQFTTLISDNNLIQTGYSNQVAVTTASEGTRPLDNVTVGTLQFVNSARRLRTLFVGTPYNTSTDGVAISTGYDQSGFAYNTTESDASKRAVYAVDGLGTGKDGINSNNVDPSQLSMGALHDIGANYDMIVACNKLGGDMTYFSGANSPGISYFASQGKIYHYVDSAGSVFFNFPILTGKNAVIRISRRGADVTVYAKDQDGNILTETKTLTSDTLPKTWQYLLNDTAGDNTNAVLGDGVVFVNGVDAEILSFYNNAIAYYL